MIEKIQDDIRDDVIFIADMDGTLTPARLPMTEKFAEFLERFIEKRYFYIVSGSDYQKICEQVPPHLIEGIGVFASMGNEFYSKGRLVYQWDFDPTPDLLQRLEDYRKNTEYNGELYPNYIEKRCGMVNFSILGRDCPHDARADYKRWDEVHSERVKIRDELAKIYPQYDISVGGNISIDIVMHGSGKEQVARKIRNAYHNSKIVFIGDRTMPGGNDYSIAQELRKLGNAEIVQVGGPDDTLDYLKKYSL